ncbi:hypothetical protein HOY80DRAFT_1033275 [Tuber brumale]|nr:hypothetical protein HOY80DRAFT_1033275 [Tuber brumale]
MDIDEDSDDALQCHYRLLKRPAEVFSQQPRRIQSRLRFLTEKSPSPALNGLTPAFSSQSQDALQHSGNLRVLKKLIEDTKNQIKLLLRENRAIQNHESHTPLEDPEATCYPELEVACDEESKSEDNLDSEAGVKVNGHVEGPDQDD